MAIPVLVTQIGIGDSAGGSHTGDKVRDERPHVDGLGEIDLNRFEGRIAGVIENGSGIGEETVVAEFGFILDFTLLQIFKAITLSGNRSSEDDGNGSEGRRWFFTDELQFEAVGDAVTDELNVERGCLSGSDPVSGG